VVVALVSSSTSGATDAQTDNRTVPVPAGATADHVVYIDLEIWLDTSTDPTINWPSGFTQIGYVESATDGFTRLYRARSTTPDVGQSGGNYAMSWTNNYWNQAQATCWSGVDETTPEDVATASAVTASNRAHAAASLTTGTAGCGMLFGTANENNATATAPTGYTQQQTANYLKTYTKIAGAAGSETIGAPGNPWSTATVKVGLLTALRPAGAGGNSTAASPATETDEAQVVGRIRTTTADVATETDEAQPAGRTRQTAVTPATETDTAQAVTSGSHTTAAGAALETDTAQVAGRTRQTAVTPATETDAAQTAGRTRVTTAAAATETDTAQPIGTPSGTPVTPATETDTAQPVGRTRTTTAGPALETDAAQLAGRTRITTAGAATETDTAQGPGRTRTTTAAPALETDTAMALFVPTSDLLLTAYVEPDRLTGAVVNQWHSEIEPGRLLAEVQR
jgi:hypothetical protein